MKLEACRAFANLLLDRKGGNKGRQQPSRTPAGDRGQEDKKTKGRLYLSEPNLGRHNNSHSEPPINNQHHHHLKKTHNLKNTTTNQSHPDNHNNYNHKPKHNSESTRKRKGHINHNHNPTLNNNTATRQGVCVNDGAPPLPAHPPPPPPVPPHAQPLPQPPQQPLPPLPGQEETWREAPGTCILPRRGLVRDEMARYRSPSNPPPASRQPPPYSRHQPPQPQSRTRGPYHHPPPPKADSRDHRVSRNLEEMLDAPRNVRENQDPPPLREGWERRHEGWLPHQRWSTRQPDSGFDSMSVPMAGEDNRRRVDSPDTRQEEEQYQSTEDLARTSRASPLSLSSVSSSSSPHYPTVRPSKQPCLTSTTHIPPHPGPRPSPLSPSASSSGLGLPHHHSTPVAPPHSASPEVALLSDSVYPQPGPQSQSLSHPDHQPRYAEIQDAGERGSGDHRLHRLSCDVRDLSDSRDVCPPRHTSARRYRDTSLPRDFRDSRIPRSYPDQREERLGREGGGRNLEDEGERRGRRPLVEAGKEVRFSGDASENLRVRDAPSSERQWGGDGADGGTVRPSDQRRGDGCNASSSSSVSWMEWTQQLQAYVAWVNSQLRKRGGPLITDLRRDLQSGVVFADLIEIISGERVSGVSRGEDSTSSQVSRDNLERVLSFMAAKRIRMTHITSKEVTEGNLKSIMRVILALAAHYKPQSVKAAPPPPPTPPDPSPPLPHPHHYPATHDVGVGPDAPTAAPDKTPNLSTNRRALMDGGGDEVGAASLRRHPSMTAAPRDSSPVYENLPRRVAPHRWAYDSLRASHKFQWSGQNQQQRRPGPITGPLPGPNRTNLDESSDDPMNHTLNTSLNTSIEVDMEDSPRRSSRPAALNFWQELITQQSPPTDTKSHQDHPQSESPISLNSQHPQDDPNNPFRYHTIHRMSGRRKLPQIPGASSGGQTSGSGSSRGTTPQQDHPQHHQHHQEGSRGVPESPLGDKNSSTGGDEGSREPEGRSQNSSPAASLVRDSSLEPWENEDLKVVLRDLNSTREQLMALHTLLQGSTDVTSRGVCTSTDIYTNTPTSTSPSFTTSSACHTSHNENPTCLTPHRPSSTCLTPHSASPTCLTPNSASPTCLTPHRASPLGPNSPCLSPTNNPLINGNESLTKMQHYKNSCDDRPSHTKDNLRRSCRKREGSTRKSHSRDTYKENHRLSQSKQHQQLETSHNHGKNNHPTQITHHNGRNRHMETSPVSKINHTENSYHHSSNKHTESPHQNNRDSKVRDDCIREDPSRDNHSRQQTARESTVLLREPTAHRSRSNHHKRLSYQELDGGPRGGAGQRNSEFLDKASGSSVKQELLHLSLARQALLAEKDELSRLLEHRENVITELRQQVQQRDRTIQAQRAHLDEALRHTHNGKRGAGVQGESPEGRNSGGQREDVQLVRDAIMSLRGNFRETDPTQHTIDTLEQAIAVLLERSGGNTGVSGGGGGGNLNHSATDKSPRSNNDKRSQLTGVGEAWTKVIYFTERTVTPFMSTVGKPLGKVKLRDFKAMFDRPGSYRFHFKSNDPEYGMVKEEIVNDDDILPGVDGKIIAWVEEDTE